MWRRLLEAFDLQAFTFQLAGPADGLGLFTGADFRRFFKSAATFHFTPQAFALHLLLQRLQSLIDIVIADAYVQIISRFLFLSIICPGFPAATVAHHRLLAPP